MVAVAAVDRISYTGGAPAAVFDHNRDSRVSASEVGVATGATVGSASYGAKLLKRVKSVNANGIKEAATANKKIINLWKRMGINATSYKEAILEFAKKTATGRFASRIVATPVFKKAAGLVGGIGAVFVFISGLGEMSNTFGKLLNKPEIINDFDYEA